MTRLTNNINTSKDFELFCEKLKLRVQNNQPISSNPMLDGVMICLIVTNIHAEAYFLGQPLERSLEDDTIDNLKEVTKWWIANEEELLKLID